VEEFRIETLVTQLQDKQGLQVTGRLDIYVSNQRVWSLYLLLGRLIWATGGIHRFRRWLRLMRQSCPEVDCQAIRTREQEIALTWEYTVLSVLLKRQRVSREQAIAFIEASLLEVLFDICQECEESDQVTSQFYSQDKIAEPIAIVNGSLMLAEAQQQWQAWCNVGLTHYSPNSAPVIKRLDEFQKHVAPQAFQMFQRLINGNRTFRDLAILMNRDVATVMRSLIPYAQRGLIGLQLLSDESLLAQTATPEPTKAGQSPLVICIDDSIQVCRMLEHILVAAGYQFIGIQDSVQALPLLLEKRPSLIFLDLVMPVASGYEICSQIRRVSSLKATPVVILTGSDGIVDRVRAKLVGASDFLGKPVQPSRVLETVQRHLANSAPNQQRPVKLPTALSSPVPDHSG